ncbi:uncharacterized protein B0H18DRAFT_1104091 [Fomitopsis serialis]|uniref:uncharacterized protein n=1 Tax=Fomitopsis serialis TaxID=139415 RepID=UPI0020083F30|nr:uncharacterized protein B0H18DRAFT_1104091 [Neoantrodia serialis]KAH9927708.1 hypothetical protein B0H18DRAFT_1104091 [Neoantrodia serialis]
MDDPTVAMFGGHHELDPGLPSGFDPLAETSFTTDVTEVSQGVPKEEVRSPDFATVISFLPTGDELEYEEHILFLHEVKRYPPGYFELKAKARSDAVWGIMEDTVKQAAEQAYRVFNEYLDDDVVRVMLHVGIWFCTVTFDRKQTEKLVPRFVTEPSSSDNWQSVPTRVSEVHSMYNIAVYDDECIGVEEYGQQFKERNDKGEESTRQGI